MLSYEDTTNHCIIIHIQIPVHLILSLDVYTWGERVSSWQVQYASKFEFCMYLNIEFNKHSETICGHYTILHVNYDNKIPSSIFMS